MLAWNELLTDLAWREILHPHFRPLQSRKWITANWLTHGKQLQEVAVWGTLKNPPPRDPFWYILNLEASLHSLLSFEWTLIRPTNSNLLRQNIVFSYSERIPVSFSWLFHYFSFFFCYFTLLLIFTKIILLLLFYYIFFHENYFYFFMFRDVPGCSGMFRNVPACSGMFRVPGFIDALKVKDKTKALALGNRGSLWEGHLDMNNLCDTIKILGDYFGGESRCWKKRRAQDSGIN